MNLNLVKKSDQLDIFQVFVFRPYQKGVLGALQPMVPLFQNQLDSQKFPVANVILPLCGRQAAREKGAMVESLVSGRLFERGHLPLPHWRHPPPRQTGDPDQAFREW